MDKEMKIQVTPEIERIMCENLNERVIEETREIHSCEECMYGYELWLRGRELYCCAYNSDNPKTSRNEKEIFDDCPINHELEYTKKYIKKYGIIHERPKGRYRRKGSIAVVDFSRTTYEWDGNNPDVDWENVVVFYYKTPEEAQVMMDLALEYYAKFNLDGEYVEKHCYG